MKQDLLFLFLIFLSCNNLDADTIGVSIGFESPWDTDAWLASKVKIKSDNFVFELISVINKPQICINKYEYSLIDMNLKVFIIYFL